jgi:hypothetical protein
MLFGLLIILSWNVKSLPCINVGIPHSSVLSRTVPCHIAVLMSATYFEQRSAIPLAQYRRFLISPFKTVVAFSLR